MSTPIDSLEIKIQSDSSQAAAGINGLATALGNLKKNGGVGTAVTNLGKLSDALGKLNRVSGDATKISRVAKAMSDLSKVGSINKTINQLNKLPGALNGLTNVNIDPSLASKLNGLVQAVQPLSKVRTSGFTSMVNSLARIADVTKKLDDTTIANFANRVSKLNTALTPLSTKMTTIQAGLRGLNSSAKTASTGVAQLGTKVNATALNLASLITIIQGVAAAIRPVVMMLSGVISQAMEWDGVAQRFGRGFGDQAEDVYAWVQRLNKEMGINVQQFMQYSSLYANMLTSFGVAYEDAAKMAVGYTELTYDIWAGYNDIYKSYAEAADAVRSAISGEVEPIRRASFTIVESQLEQTAANYGLEISLEKATEAQKSYLRYLTLVDQAHAQNLIGTYARELNTAEGLMRTFSQQMKSLAQTFGSLFLPILVKVMPWLQAFIDLLTEAIVTLAAFFGIEIQPVSWGASSGLDGIADSANNAAGSLDDTKDSADSATKAIEDLKKATLGLDELNVISPPNDRGSGGSGSGGGAGGGTGGAFDGLDIDSMWDEAIFDQIKSQVDAIKEKLADWLPVLEVVGAALAGLAMATLLKNLGDALSQMNLLQKALATVAIAVIEAALVFKFADDYLEEGKLISLIGEAVATAVGSYLLYRTWGPKGLVLGIGISIAAQLAAITLNLADGGVELTDPQLWIQSAFTTALAGVAGGWMAYKGLIPMSTGKGVGLGLLVGLSLTLAAITIGDISASGEVTAANIFTGLGSILAAAGFGFTVGGVYGALIGAGVALAINIVGAIVGAVSNETKKTVEEEIADRLGEIELSGEMMDVYIDQITAIPREVTIKRSVWDDKLQDYNLGEVTMTVDAALDIYKAEIKNLEAIESSIDAALREIDVMNIQIALGMDVSEKNYKSAIDSYVSNAQKYLDQYYLTANIGLEILGGNDDLAKTLSNFYTTNSAKLSELGARLKSTVSEAFVDGEWIPDKLTEAMEIQKEIQEILDYVGEVEYRAKLQNLTLSVSGDSLTPESFKGVLEGAKTAIEDRLNTLEEVKMSSLQVAVMEYDANIAAGVSEAEAKKIYDKTVADIEREYQNGRVDVTYGTIDFGLSTIFDAFEEEMKLAQDKGWFNVGNKINAVLDLDSAFKFDDGEGEIYGNIEFFAYRVSESIQTELYAVKPEVRKAMAELLEELEPTMAEYEEIASAARIAGEKVPDEVRAGLSDYNRLKALSGDVDAINYLIGEGFSTDSTFMNTLATVEGAGAAIDKNVAKGLLNNMSLVRDEATGVVTGIKNSVTGETTAITPELVENMKTLGVDLTDGLSAGMEQDKPSLWTRLKNWWTDFWDRMRGKDGIDAHSPSRKAIALMEDVTDGLVEGLSLTALTDRFSDMWDKVKSWWTGKSDLEDAEVDVSLRKDGWTTVKDWIGKIPGVEQTVKLAKSGWSTVKDWIGKIPSVDQAVKLAKSGWTTIKGWIGSIPSVSQAVSLAKSGWTTIKKWVGTIPSVSQAVGLAKSGWTTVKKWVGTMPTLNAGIKLVKDGWTSVKKWLGDLNFNLGFKLPKIKVEWGEKTYAGFTIKYPTGFSTYAKGGFPDMGELFIAREAGPEMVGKIGSRTTVANNQQIVEGISEGVYAAVLAAMRASEGDGNQAVNVYLDGRQIVSSVERRQHERGASLMGKQVHAY